MKKYLLFIFILISCRPNQTLSSEKTVSGGTHGAEVPSQTPSGNHTQESGVDTDSPGGPNGSLQGAVKTLCSTTLGDANRKKALDFLEAYKPGSREFSSTEAAKGKTQCVDSLMPAAIYTNLISGVPAGTLVGQAVQETGYCTSELAKNALNFHGQKATLSKSFFSYWNGDFYSKSSSESVTGSGNNVVSNFMKFTHADFSFVSVAERFLHPDLQVYKPCMAKRAQPEEFMTCVGAKWAVHGTYATIVLGTRKTLKLDACEIPEKEWRLVKKFQ